jgi:hypothetical protein
VAWAGPKISILSIPVPCSVRLARVQGFWNGKGKQSRQQRRCRYKMLSSGATSLFFPLIDPVLVREEL